MLAADKLQLQSALKQQATALKEKEFNLHHSNLMTVGTQAAVLAGLDITMFIEFNPPAEDSWEEDYRSLGHVLRMVYYGVIVGAFCANMMVVAHTTALSVLGAGLALRGPDGSMMTATDGLYQERNSVFRVFGAGLALTVGSVLVSVWLLLRWEAALVCWIVTLITCRTMYTNYRRVAARFDYDESETVDFRDIMEGPAAIRGVPMYGKPSRRKVLQAAALLQRQLPVQSNYYCRKTTATDEINASYDASETGDDYDDHDDDIDADWNHRRPDVESQQMLAPRKRSAGEIKRRNNGNGNGTRTNTRDPIQTV
jgi:hypothetical protein